MGASMSVVIVSNLVPMLNTVARCRCDDDVDDLPDATPVLCVCIDTLIHSPVAAVRAALIAALKDDPPAPPREPSSDASKSVDVATSEY
jgi:hypothetical protein